MLCDDSCNKLNSVINIISFTDQFSIAYSVPVTVIVMAIREWIGKVRPFLNLFIIYINIYSSGVQSISISLSHKPKIFLGNSRYFCSALFWPNSASDQWQLLFFGDQFLFAIFIFALIFPFTILMPVAVVVVIEKINNGDEKKNEWKKNIFTTEEQRNETSVYYVCPSKCSQHQMLA